MTENKDSSKPPPLEIKCTSTDCDNDLHCFKRLKKMSPDELGKCRACGADLIDWPRVHRRDLSDAAHTFEMLRHECIRHHFFHIPIDEAAVNHARRKGRARLSDDVRRRIRKALAPSTPVRDGRQTPIKDITNSIHYAQHATATCCRTCLEYWHGIAKGQPLTEDEIEYCAALIDLYLKERLPDLKDEPEHVPPRKKAAAAHTG